MSSIQHWLSQTRPLACQTIKSYRLLQWLVLACLGQASKRKTLERLRATNPSEIELKYCGLWPMIYWFWHTSLSIPGSSLAPASSKMFRTWNFAFSAASCRGVFDSCERYKVTTKYVFEGPFTVYEGSTGTGHESLLVNPRGPSPRSGSTSD